MSNLHNIEDMATKNIQFLNGNGDYIMPLACGVHDKRSFTNKTPGITVPHSVNTTTTSAAPSLWNTNTQYSVVSGNYYVVIMKVTILEGNTATVGNIRTVPYYTSNTALSITSVSAGHLTLTNLEVGKSYYVYWYFKSNATASNIVTKLMGNNGGTASRTYKMSVAFSCCFACASSDEANLILGNKDLITQAGLDTDEDLLLAMNNAIAARDAYGKPITSSTAAATVAKTATADVFALETGRHYLLSFGSLNTAANPTLNINSTGAKRYYYNGVLVTSKYDSPRAGELLDVYYDGTNYQMFSLYPYGLSGGAESPTAVSTPRCLLSSNPFVNAYFAEIYFADYSPTSTYTVKVARNYNQISLTFYKDGTSIGTAAYVMWTAATATTITVTAPTIRAISGSAGYFVESRNNIAKYYLESVMTGTSSVLGTFTLNSHIVSQPLNPLLRSEYNILPRTSYYTNVIDTTDDNWRQIIKEVYIPGADGSSVYTLAFSTNYYNLTVTLTKDGVAAGSCTFTAIDNSGGNALIVSQFDGVVHTLKSGSVTVGYFMLKGTAAYRSWHIGSGMQVSSTYESPALKTLVIRDMTCNPGINTAMNSGGGSGSSPWNDKIIAMYGDSVSAGDDATKPYAVAGWVQRVADRIGAAALYNRSIPGTSNRYGSDGGYVSVVNSTGHYTHTGYLDNNYAKSYDAYVADPSIVTPPAGQTVICSAGCSWKRITSMFPESIKDTIDAVFVFFHNDSGSSVSPSWVAGSTKDPDWNVAGNDYYTPYGGDFNIEETTGAIYSSIMKLQAWMPQALIVLCTPASTGGAAGGAISPSTISRGANATHAENVRSAALGNGIPVIDVYANDAINFRNRNLYVNDTIHPNSEGGLMLARVFIGELNRIIPRL